MPTELARPLTRAEALRAVLGRAEDLLDYCRGVRVGLSYADALRQAIADYDAANQITQPNPNGEPS